MWQVIPMTAAHIPALAEIEKQSFAHPWSAAALAAELQNPQATFLVAVDADGVPGGYVGLQTAAGEGYFTNIAVRPERRRQGCADALMQALITVAHAAALTRLTLEVRVSNAAAQALYRKYGFVQDGIRPRFYTAPAEDAAIMSLYF